MKQRGGKTDRFEPDRGKKEIAAIKILAYQQKVAQLYNMQISERSFKVGDLVLGEVIANTKIPTDGNLGQHKKDRMKSSKSSGNEHTDSRAWQIWNGRLQALGTPCI